MYSKTTTLHSSLTSLENTFPSNSRTIKERGSEHKHHGTCILQYEGKGKEVCRMASDPEATYHPKTLLPQWQAHVRGEKPEEKGEALLPVIHFLIHKPQLSCLWRLQFTQNSDAQESNGPRGGVSAAHLLPPTFILCVFYNISRHGPHPATGGRAELGRGALYNCSVAICQPGQAACSCLHILNTL